MTTRRDFLGALAGCFALPSVAKAVWEKAKPAQDSNALTLAKFETALDRFKYEQDIGYRDYTTPFFDPQTWTSDPS